MINSVEINQKAWNLRTPFHIASDFYGVEAFLKGASTIKRLEKDLCGDAKNLELLHLQCHFGLDTLSWVRLGAKVTGVDISEIAINAARHLADRASLNATFLQGDVQSLPNCLNDRFDRVISTYGTLCWLSNLSVWAEGISRVLNTGGQLIIVEFHPMLDVLFDGCVSAKAEYFGSDVRTIKSKATYAAKNAAIEYTECLWQHPVSEVITALLKAGLILKKFNEHPFCSYQIVSQLDIKKGDYWVCSDNPLRSPFLYSIVASKP